MPGAARAGIGLLIMGALLVGFGQYFERGALSLYGVIIVAGGFILYMAASIVAKRRASNQDASIFLFLKLLYCSQKHICPTTCNLMNLLPNFSTDFFAGKRDKESCRKHLTTIIVSFILDQRETGRLQLLISKTNLQPCKTTKDYCYYRLFRTTIPEHEKPAVRI